MGRRSSDTEEEGRSRRKKKHRRRSSSSSSSDSRAHSRKKSGRKSRSRSRSRDLPSWSHSYEKRRRHRSSSSSSYGSRRKRSRSRGRGKSYRSQRSRSKSRTRRSRSRARQRSYSRSSERSGQRRTPSASRERRRGRDKDKAKDKDKGRGKEKEAHGTKAGDSANIKAGLEHLTPAEQAKARLQLVLEAAAKADEALKAKERSEEEAKRRKEEDQATLLDQVKRVKEIEAIESDAFVPQTFRSSKEVKKSAEPAELQQEPVSVGATEAAAAEKEPPAANIPTAIKYQDDNSLAHPNWDADFGDPFSAMDRMMSNMRNSMLEMHRKFDDLSIQPEGHSFSSSSVMTYSRVGDEPPKVFQASAQTRTAPGGVKETRKALKDSESGVEKISVGHHIQDRAHVIKKSKNSKTGDEELNQEFINLDESEADTFNEEWQKEVMKFRPCRSREAVQASRSRSGHYNHRESGARRGKLLGAPGSRVPRDSLEALSVKGTPVPLKGSRK
ncbi:uncharacterized protein LOC110476133 [Lonchura striata]